MSCKEQEYTDISALLEKSKPPTLIEHKVGHRQYRLTGDPIEVGDDVLVKSRKNLEVLVTVESVGLNTIRGQITRVLGEEHQDLSVGVKVKISNEHVSCVYC